MKGVAKPALIPGGNDLTQRLMRLHFIGPDARLSGTASALLKNFSKPEHAIYFEQQLERYLGIRDEPEEGELPR